MKSERELLELKEKITRTSDRLKEGRGALKQLLKDLKDRFEVATLKEGRKKEDELEVKLGKREARLEKEVKKFREKYEHAIQSV